MNAINFKLNWKPIPWYIRFLLMFQKAQVGIDWADSSSFTTTVVVGKKLFGVVYVVDTFEVDNRQDIREEV